VKYVWLIVAVFSARFLVTAIAFPEVDGDLGWQRWLGAQILELHRVPRALGNETFTAAGAPWLPQEWAFATLAALARSGVLWYLFAGAVAACASAALLLGAYRAVRRGASARAVPVTTTFAGIALLGSFGVRAQVVAWALLALYVLLLDLETPWLWLSVPVAALWSNFHASAALAPVLAAAAAAGSALDEGRFGPRARVLAWLTLASLVAICCNPAGWDLPVYALDLLTNPIKAYIIEWKVTDLGEWTFAWGALPLLALAAWVGTRSIRKWSDALVFGGFAVLMLEAARNIALFGIIGAPIVALALSRAIPWFAAETDEPAARRPWLLPAFALALTLAVALYLVRSSGRVETTLATKALAALERVPGNHRLYCGDFAWCGFAVGEPRVAVFLDGRADPYPLAVWEDFLAIARLESGWRERLAARRVNAIVAGRDSPLDQALTRTPNWRAVFSDPRYRLWLLNSAGAAVVPRHEPQHGREFLGPRGVFASVARVTGIRVILRQALQ